MSFDSVSLGTVNISDSLYTLLQEKNLGIVCACHCWCASNSDHDGVRQPDSKLPEKFDPDLKSSLDGGPRARP